MPSTPHLMIILLLLNIALLCPTTSDRTFQHDRRKAHPLALRGGQALPTKIRVRTDSEPAAPEGEGWEQLPLGTFMVQTDQDSHGQTMLADEDEVSVHNATENEATTSTCAPLPAENRTRHVRRLVDQARVFRQNGNLGVAEGNLQEALEISNFAAVPLCELVALKIQQNKVTDANELLFRGIERHPRLPQLHSMRGDLLCRQVSWVWELRVTGDG